MKWNTDTADTSIEELLLLFQNASSLNQTGQFITSISYNI